LHKLAHIRIGQTLVKLAIQTAAGIAMAVLVIAIGNRLYTKAELEATTEAVAKLNSDAARANSEMQAQRDAELVGQRAQADAIVQARLQDNAAKARAQANLATQKTAIRKN
jgi:hypothetical protein